MTWLARLSLAAVPLTAIVVSPACNQNVAAGSLPRVTSAQQPQPEPATELIKSNRRPPPEEAAVESITDGRAPECPAGGGNGATAAVPTPQTRPDMEGNLMLRHRPIKCNRAPCPQLRISQAGKVRFLNGLRYTCSTPVALRRSPSAGGDMTFVGEAWIDAQGVAIIAATPAPVIKGK